VELVLYEAAKAGPTSSASSCIAGASGNGAHRLLRSFSAGKVFHANGRSEFLRADAVSSLRQQSDGSRYSRQCRTLRAGVSS
jgi:hypothetical protein